MKPISSSLPSNYSAADGSRSIIGIGLFALTVGVLIYQIHFYKTLIGDVKNHSDLESSVARLERTSLKEV